jgi:hypothetical protein
MFAEQARLANSRITIALIPSGETGRRNWQGANSYARDHLPSHAAACGFLDELVNDPGFLIIARPEAVLASRGSLHTHEARTAIAAFELSLDRWDPAPTTTASDA